MAYRETAKVKAHKQDLRRRILDAARELIAEGGYPAAQMGAVAEAAGVATGTLYRYFPSKAELFAQVFRDAVQHEVDAVAWAANQAGSVLERLQAGIETFVRRALKSGRLAYALLAEPVDPAVESERLSYRRSYIDIFEALIEQGVSTGELPRQDAGFTATALVGAMAETLVGPLSPRADAGAAGVRPEAEQDRLLQSIIQFSLRAVTGSHES